MASISQACLQLTRYRVASLLGIYLKYYSSHPPINSTAGLAAIGTCATVRERFFLLSNRHV
ncbi:hypothetical protein GGR57DRAFT_468222 [Xylariaceae sp. FL1272]|nr:hypothetical protein GGR57DRAFT_468222 [Xylariaceae sp. FL1272]